VNDGSQALNLIYLLIILVAVVAAFSIRRVPVGKTVKMALAWVLIFAAGFAIFALREDFKALGSRLWAAVTGSTVQETQGGELRIAMAEDGHFWVEGELNGHDVRFLVDSGATVTTIGQETATEAGIVADGRRAPVSTANGVVLMDQGRADRLTLGPIERTDFPMFIAREDTINVIGMNFLSSLSRWSVEGRTLVLRP
jgi:aspartyl protease family protein